MLPTLLSIQGYTIFDKSLRQEALHLPSSHYTLCTKAEDL